MLSEAAVSAAAADAEYIFHCAYNPRDPESNIVGTQNLIASARQRNLRRFVHVSSFAVYQPFPEVLINEAAGDGDRSIAYVDVKLRLEEMIIEAAKSGQLKGTIVQPAIVFGSGCWAWTIAPADLLKSGNVVLPLNGSGRCNLVYIDDLIQAMLRAAVSPKAVGRRFLISGSEKLTWRDFYAALAGQIGFPGPIDVDALPNDIRTLIETADRVRPADWRSRLPQPIHQLMTRLFPGSATVHRPPSELNNMFICTGEADITLARTMLDFEPRFTLHKGLKHMRTLGDASEVVV